MALVDPAKIRNIAVVGHRGAGKTSLVEALLFTTGAKNRLGTVVDGTTAMDHDEDEIKRQMTISAGLAHVDWAGHKINLVDTPGEASFINEALGTLPRGRGRPHGGQRRHQGRGADRAPLEARHAKWACPAWRPST